MIEFALYALTGWVIGTVGYCVGYRAGRRNGRQIRSVPNQRSPGLLSPLLDVPNDLAIAEVMERMKRQVTERPFRTNGDKP